MFEKIVIKTPRTEKRYTIQLHEASTQKCVVRAKKQKNAEQAKNKKQKPVPK